MQPLKVFVTHDATDRVWFVDSSDIPGLNAEADTYETLVEVIMDLAPDLIDHNLGQVVGDLLAVPVSIQHSTLIKRAA